MKNNYTIAVLSYEIWHHPRAIKIAKTLARNGYKVKLWGARKAFKHGPRILRALMNYLLSMFEVLSMNADLYWIENIPDIAYLFIPLFRRKYVYDRRSPWAKEVQVELETKCLYFIIEAIERFIINNADYISVVSTPMLYEYKYARSVSVIPNYPEKSFKQKPGRDLRKELKVSNSTKVFIYIGKLSIMEGTDLLSEVAEKLDGLNAELWVVGDGPARNIVKELCRRKNHVRWFGWIERQYLVDYIVAADYGLVPRHKTAFSIFYNYEGVQKIGEYFLYSKPVIACGIAPSPYYLVVDPEEFAETVARVARGEIVPPKPPIHLIWEKYSEREIIKIINKILLHIE